MRGRERRIYAVTLLGGAGNALLVAFKFMAALWGHSAAMLADASHSLSDLATDAMVLVFTRLASKPQDEDHDYGHGKYETLAAALVALLLMAAGAALLWGGLRSVWRFLHGCPPPLPGAVALWAALVSVAVKEALYRVTARVGRDVGSRAVVANAWHHRSDALSSVGTALGIGGARALGGPWAVLDPLAAIVVSLFIMRAALRIMSEASAELTDTSLPPDTERRITELLLSEPQVFEPHNLRTRRVGSRVALEVHVRMDGTMSVARSHEITRRLESGLRGLLGRDAFINIHVEPRP